MRAYYIFIYLRQDIRDTMKEKTIDYVLRTTWLAVQRMYNEEASDYGITMAKKGLLKQKNRHDLGVQGSISLMAPSARIPTCG